MGSLAHLQATFEMVLAAALFLVELFAFIDCLRHRQDAFPAASKRTKPFWLAITGGAAAIGFLAIGAGLLLMIVAIVGAGVYLADVRPAVQQVLGRAKGNNSGPYGPW